MRGQAGVVSQPGHSGAKAKQAEQSGGKAAGQASETAEVKASGLVSEQTNGAAGQMKEAVEAKAAAAQMDSPSAQLQALSKGGAQTADADNVQSATTGAAESKALEKVEKADDAKLLLPGVDAGDRKAAKAKSGKDGKADQADQAGKSNKAGKNIAEKLPQVPVQVAALDAAVAPVSAPLRPISQKSAAVEGVVFPRASNAATSAAKPPSGKPGQQAAKGMAETTGKTQGAPDGAGIPMPDALPAPQGAQAATEDLAGFADSDDVPDIKNAAKPDAAAITSKSGGDVVRQAKHLNSPVPTAVPAAQAAQAAVAGLGETTVHISASPQNVAGVSGPAVGALHGAALGGVSPYDRIDQGTAPVVLHAGAQQVAVGVHDPSLGWVEIKTQSAAGHVDATLVASSTQTHDALAAQLPAISQFLEQRDVRLGTLVVNHQSAGSGTNHFGNGPGGGGAGTQHAGQGYGGNGGSGGNGANGGGERRAPQYSAPVPVPHSGPVTGAGGEGGSSGRPLSYISVRA